MSTYLWWMAFSASASLCVLAGLAVYYVVQTHRPARRAAFAACAVILFIVGFSGVGFSGVGFTIGHGITSCTATKADPQRSCF